MMPKYVDNFLIILNDIYYPSSATYKLHHEQGQLNNFFR